MMHYVLLVKYFDCKSIYFKEDFAHVYAFELVSEPYSFAKYLSLLTIFVPFNRDEQLRRADIKNKKYQVKVIFNTKEVSKTAPK